MLGEIKNRIFVISSLTFIHNRWLWNLILYQHQQLQLNEEDEEDLLGGRWLNDGHFAVVNALLKHQ